MNLQGCVKDLKFLFQSDSPFVLGPVQTFLCRILNWICIRNLLIDLV